METAILYTVCYSCFISFASLLPSLFPLPFFFFCFLDHLPNKLSAPNFLSQALFGWVAGEGGIQAKTMSFEVLMYNANRKRGALEPFSCSRDSTWINPSKGEARMGRNVQESEQLVPCQGNKERWVLWSEAICKYTEGTKGAVWERGTW